MNIRPVTPADAAAWNVMRTALWPYGDSADGTHRDEISAFFAGTVREPEAVFVAEVPDPAQCAVAVPAAVLIGFAELSRRTDYVEGAATCPVAYLEGWYVVPDWRRCGVGTALLQRAEQWAAENGMTELASAAALDNEPSLKAHSAFGFQPKAALLHLLKPVFRNSVADAGVSTAPAA